MSVQDDIREQELCNLFNLVWDPEHARGGEDAWFEAKLKGKAVQVPVEVKSTTTDSVSTARDFSADHLRKWRERILVIGFYTKSSGSKPRLISSLCLTPAEMEPWISEQERRIGPDIEIARRVSGKLTMDDLHAICGTKLVYSLDDARRLYKKQWNAAEYKAAMDSKNGYSPVRMLAILQQRAEYLMSRGATLNNPHISKTFLQQFDGQRITKEHAARIREKFKTYFSQKP